MRILAITDLHAVLQPNAQGGYYTSPTKYFAALEKRAKEADLVVCSGDISLFGDEMLESLAAMDSWGKPVFLIHGNHEDPDTLVDVTARYPNLHFVHGKEHEHAGLRIFGWGGGGFSAEDKALATASKQLKPHDNRILLFHGPPYGTTLDWMDNWQAYRGNKTYRQVIERLQPLFVVVGHLHENIGKHDKIGRSLVLNPGPLGKLIKLENSSKAAALKPAAKKTVKKSPTKKKK